VGDSELFHRPDQLPRFRERHFKRRWRIEAMQVEINLGNAPEAIPPLDRALSQFEDFCVVTQSVRAGIDVNVSVIAPDGRVLN